MLEWLQVFSSNFAYLLALRALNTAAIKDVVHSDSGCVAGQAAGTKTDCRKFGGDPGSDASHRDKWLQASTRGCVSRASLERMATSARAETSRAEDADQGPVLQSAAFENKDSSQAISGFIAMPLPVHRVRIFVMIAPTHFHHSAHLGTQH